MADTNPSLNSFGLRPVQGTTTYVLRQKMLDLKDDFTILEGKKPAFKVSSKLLSLTKNLMFEDIHGQQLAALQQPMMTGKGSLSIVDEKGRQLGVVKRSKRGNTVGYQVSFRGAAPLQVVGNVGEHDFEIRSGGNVLARTIDVAQLVGDDYKIEIAHGTDDVLVLAAAVALDILSEKDKKEGVTSAQTQPTSTMPGVPFPGIPMPQPPATKAKPKPQKSTDGGVKLPKRGEIPMLESDPVEPTSDQPVTVLGLEDAAPKADEVLLDLSQADEASKGQPTVKATPKPGKTSHKK